MPHPSAACSVDARRRVEAESNAGPGAKTPDTGAIPRTTPKGTVAVGSGASGTHAECRVRESSVTPPVLLLLEDEPSTRGAAAATLHLKGYHVIEGQSAGEGISILSTGTRVDAVFSDINMPGHMNGVAFAEWVAERHPTIPVLLTSGAPECSLSVHPSARRAFISKPYELDEVDRRLRKML